MFAGMSEDGMIEILYSGLRNDSEAETISVKQTLQGCYIPCQYIKIQPLLAHDQKFNFSIWSVELRGTMDPLVLRGIIDDFNHLKQQETVRSCLAFFRNRQLNDTYQALQQQTGVALEDSALSDLYQALVDDADYDRVENLLCQVESQGRFASSRDKIPYAAKWKGEDVSAYPVPSPRGGHQMCVDEAARVAYMYGGWDGSNNLCDMWMLCLDTGKWTCVSTDTREQGGPGPRSCHAMCFDSVHKCIYVMGKYIDREYRDSTVLENDLYCYDTVNGEWIILSENTEALNGPMLVFNTQMVFDPKQVCIYVYGGMVILPDVNDSRIVYSGLYRFDLRQYRWTKLKKDAHMLEQENHVRGRFFHSLEIDPELQRIYILSIKRDVSHPSDIIIYDIASNTFFEKLPDLSASNSVKQSMTQQRYLSEQQRLNPIYKALRSRPPSPPPESSDHHPHHVHLVQDGRTIRTSLDTKRQELYVLASSQHEASPLAGGYFSQAILAANGDGSLALGRRSAVSSSSHDYLTDNSNGSNVDSNSATMSYIRAMGLGFHPCSTLMDSGVRYDTRGRPVSSSSFTNSSGMLRQSGKYSGGSSAKQRKCRLPAEHIFMVIYCYHIPTETWTEVYNSAYTSALYAADIESGYSADEDTQMSGPPFPPPRFAQNWAFDRATRRHFMFGGNPNRPSDKSARFNDTWEVTMNRPSTSDILRRALYLVRQRRFLDICMGTHKLPLGLRSIEVNGKMNRCMSESQTEASAIPSPNSNCPLRTDLPKLLTYDNTAQALEYLQKHVAPLVDYTSIRECQLFHALSTALFQIPTLSSPSPFISNNDKVPGCHPASRLLSGSQDSLRNDRIELYNALLSLFPEGYQQPQTSLEDMIIANGE